MNAPYKPAMGVQEELKNKKNHKAKQTNITVVLELPGTRRTGLKAQYWARKQFLTGDKTYKTPQGGAESHTVQSDSEDIAAVSQEDHFTLEK